MPANANEGLNKNENLNKEKNSSGYFSTYFKGKGKVQHKINLSQNNYSKTFAKILGRGNLKLKNPAGNRIQISMSPRVVAAGEIEIGPKTTKEREKRVLIDQHFGKCEKIIGRVSEVHAQPKQRAQLKINFGPTARIRERKNVAMNFDNSGSNSTHGGLNTKHTENSLIPKEKRKLTISPNKILKIKIPSTSPIFDQSNIKK